MQDEFRWQVVCDEETFQELQGDERFIALLTLGRTVNAIRFYHLAYLEAKDDETPSGKRQWMNAFMFLGAALREALGYANTLGKMFSEEGAFDCFRELLGQETTKTYRNGILRHLRNKVTAHFDEQITASTLTELEFSDPKLVVGEGRSVGGSYYDLADEVAVHSVLVAETDEPRSWSELENLMKQTAEISAEFGRCADRLIGEMAKQMGWTFLAHSDA